MKARIVLLGVILLRLSLALPGDLRAAEVPPDFGKVTEKHMMISINHRVANTLP